MPEIAFAGIILAALSGLYYAIWKNHGCIKKVEGHLKQLIDIENFKQDLVDLKDEINNLK